MPGAGRTLRGTARGAAVAVCLGAVTALTAIGFSTMTLTLAAPPVAAQAPLETLQRMEALEIALQRLTAHVERLEFEQRQEAGRADARLSDLEFRITELEGGDPTAALRAAEPAAPQRPGSEQPAPPPTAPSTAPPQPDATPLAPGPAPLGALRATVTPDERASFDAVARVIETDGPDAGRDSVAAFLASHPDSILAGEAQNLLGRAYAREGRHQEAARSYLAGVRDHGAAPAADANLLGLATALTDLGRPSEACATLAELAARFADATPGLRAQASEEALRAGCP